MSEVWKPELWKHSALQLGDLLGQGKVSSREVVQAHLDRIAEVNPTVNAVTRTQEASALDAADEADRRAGAGERLSPLDGVPFTTKENLDCVGVPTTEGIVALADAMPTADAPVVERMKAAGAVPLARTNMPDFGLRVHTDNELHGQTLNPWDSGRTCGGSSGGEGVAIATGMTPMGLGNDIGGSVRNPAFCSGITAHKPTPHRLPRASSVPPTSPGPAGQLMSVNGPMARSVEDLISMFELIHGRHGRDPWSVTSPFEPDRSQRPAIALVPEVPGGDTDPEIAAGVRTAGEVLAANGFEVVEVAPPAITEAGEAWLGWLGGEIHVRRAVLDSVMGADSRRFLELVDDPAIAELAVTIEALTARHDIAQQWLAFFAQYPVVVGPAWTQHPFQVGQDIAGRDEAMQVLNNLRLIVVANVLGLPATALPVGVTAGGLPLGVQVISEQHADDRCLAVAAIIEDGVEPLTPIDPR